MSMLDALAQLNIKPAEMPTDCISRTDRTLAHAVIHCGDFSVKLMWSNHHWYPVLYHMDKRMCFEPEKDLSLAFRRAESIAVAMLKANPVSAPTQSAS